MTSAVLLLLAALSRRGDAQGLAAGSGAGISMPEGMKDFIGRDYCGGPRWERFYANLAQAVEAHNEYDFPACITLLGKAMRDQFLPIESSEGAFECSTGMAAASQVLANCFEASGMPVRALRQRQWTSILASYDYQMKGEEYIDQSQWPLRWEDTISSMLTTKAAVMRTIEDRRHPWSREPTRKAIKSAGVVSQKDLKIAIVSVCDYNAAATPLAELSKRNKKAYADLHGYDLIVHTKSPMHHDAFTDIADIYPSRPPAWSKIDAVMEALGSGHYDWVMWMDCDSYFMTPEVRLEDVLALAAAEHSGGNAGQLKPSERTKARVRKLAAWRPSNTTTTRSKLMRKFDNLVEKIVEEERLETGDHPQVSRRVSQLLLADSDIPALLGKEEGLQLITSEDGLMLNTGIFFIKSTPWGYWFMHKTRSMTFNRSPMTFHPWWDQTGVMWWLSLPVQLAAFADANSTLEGDYNDKDDNLGHIPAVHFLPQKQLNVYPPVVASMLKTHIAHEEGDFIVSFSGCKIYSSQSLCNMLMVTYFTMVPGMADQLPANSQFSFSGMEVDPMASAPHVYPAHQAIVVGGGLAGLTAAHTIMQEGGRCLIIEKAPICGGNSMKAKSGMNAVPTAAQASEGIKDSVQCFEDDTVRGGAKRSELVHELCEESADALGWLKMSFGVDLPIVSRMGGHSQPRTHRAKQFFPGVAITYPLLDRFEKLTKQANSQARLITNAQVTELLRSPDHERVIGVKYVDSNGKEYAEYGPVILATGGFGADFSGSSLIAKHRPDLLHLPTTNAVQVTGDGIKIAENVGASTVDMEWVQVHPTGIIDPRNPDARVKFLAAEALRGAGGILIDQSGERFCNELGRRDYIVSEMWRHQGPFRLVLNSKAARDVEMHCRHYQNLQLMQEFGSAADLAEEMHIPAGKLEKTFKVYSTAASKSASSPAGGPYPAFASGGSWDQFGKMYFPNAPIAAADKLHVLVVTPSVHYCMGGLAISENAEVKRLNDSSRQRVVNGLYAAGEVAGGIHGSNRLGGSALLDCVVFGRIAGKHCASYMFGPKGDCRPFPKCDRL
ncbi:hypothetical protein FOL47_009268 [Perkinsus chesapeaki]|uniref:FAD-dependent oxidoreductase 2 FAD-binding domain-containing protein n=1 Tax=Perkinsus chesapeaki TaxID=330153 RepID=A0A7J6L9A1_PERCH|nr:hypothetical protein FOL47_009268 [Perkinsus chesapeaki]